MNYFSIKRVITVKLITGSVNITYITVLNKLIEFIFCLVSNSFYCVCLHVKLSVSQIYFFQRSDNLRVSEWVSEWLSESVFCSYLLSINMCKCKYNIQYSNLPKIVEWKEQQRQPSCVLGRNHHCCRQFSKPSAGKSTFLLFLLNLSTYCVVLVMCDCHIIFVVVKLYLWIDF